MLGYPFFMRLVVMRWNGNPDINPNSVFSSHDGEIESYGYFQIEELPNLMIENGARQALEFYRPILFPIQ